MNKSGNMFLINPAPHLCQECACEHEPEMPHNRQSLFYQVKFKMEHGRDATWKDAMAHCPEDVRVRWVEAMKMTFSEKKEPKAAKLFAKFLEEIE